MRLFAVVDLKLYGVAVDLFDQLDRGQKEFVFGYIRDLRADRRRV